LQHHHPIHLSVLCIGVDPQATGSTITDLIREIDLDEKASEFSEGLSGGQKRKLSVGIALIGDPRILCLGKFCEREGERKLRCQCRISFLITKNQRRNWDTPYLQ
jgi:ABC-type uncharacterized transport system YnjBCD ATPase subunit